MNVVRNIVLLVASAGLISAGLFSSVVVPPTPIPSSGNGNQAGSGVGTTTPSLPSGAQVAFGSTNSVNPPTVNTTPNPPSDSTGAVQGFVSGLPQDYSANYAANTAPLLQAFIDGLRSAAKVPALAYDPVLGQAAANLISDTISTGQGFPTQGTAVNSQGQTPIQQVKSVSTTSKATYVSALSFVSDALLAAEATDPQTGLS